MSNSIRQGDQDGSFFDDNEADTDNEWTFMIDSFVRIAMNTTMVNNMPFRGKDNIIEPYLLTLTFSHSKLFVRAPYGSEKKPAPLSFLFKRYLLGVFPFDSD